MKHASLVVLVLGVASAAAPLGAQVPLDRPPNLAGTWIPDGGVVRFDFIHRFWVTPGPNSGVINCPTFTVAAGRPWHLGLGLRYATKGSDANESELYARWRAQRGPFAVSITPAYNVTLKSVDG